MGLAEAGPTLPGEGHLRPSWQVGKQSHRTCGWCWVTFTTTALVQLAAERAWQHTGLCAGLLVVVVPSTELCWRRALGLTELHCRAAEPSLRADSGLRAALGGILPGEAGAGASLCAVSFCSADVDECEDPAVQCRGGECRNTPGSYECHCPAGFELLNGTVCQGTNPSLQPPGSGARSCPTDPLLSWQGGCQCQCR